MYVCVYTCVCMCLDVCVCLCVVHFEQDIAISAIETLQRTQLAG